MSTYPPLTRDQLRISPDVQIGMIWAQTTGRIIGDGQDMPWFLPEDLAHFKRSTTGYAVVMGRTSWEALPASYRPLPGRENFVVTRNPDYTAPGGHVHPDLPSAIEAAARWAQQHPPAEEAGVTEATGTGNTPPPSATEPTETTGGSGAATINKKAGGAAPTVWILGGGQVYEQCLPIADRIVITTIDMRAPKRFRVTAPTIDPAEFREEAGPWLTSAKGRAVPGSMVPAAGDVAVPPAPNAEHAAAPSALNTGDSVADAAETAHGADTWPLRYQISQWFRREAF